MLPTKPDHECRPRQPAQLTTFAAQGWYEYEHRPALDGNLVAAKLTAEADMRVAERLGYQSMLLADTDGGWLVMVRRGE